MSWVIRTLGTGCTLPSSGYPLPMALHESISIDLRAHGPRLPVTLSVPSNAMTRLKAEGKNVPAPIETIALIDTAASNTCITPQHARALGLTPLGTTEILTGAGVTPEGEGITKNIYEVRITISPDYSEDLMVLETDTVWINAGALIGRDVLTKAVLIYGGPGGTCTLQL
jgi:hypothetical protein